MIDVDEPSRAYNIARQPCVMVLNREGATEELSLIEVFRRAPDLLKVVGEVPTVAFAVIRLLEVVLHRALRGPRDIESWAHSAKDWPGVVSQVDAYLTHFERRFDLFDRDAPFMQVADLASAKGEFFGLERLIADVPSGAAFMTTRFGRGIEQIAPGEAFRWLLHAHAADPSGIKTGAVGDERGTGGKVYPEGPGWMGQIGGIYLEGANLAETLMLNLIALDTQDLGLETGSGDIPVWEREAMTESVDESNGGQPRGVIDTYVWQARRVRLQGDVRGVTGVLLCYGDRMTPYNRQPYEPMTGWRHSEPQTKKFGRDTYMPRAHDPARSFWRGLGALLPAAPVPRRASGAALFEPPALLQWAAILKHAELISRNFVRIHAVGIEYGSQQSTYAEIIDDQVDLPTRVLDSPELSTLVLDAVEVASTVARAIGDLAKNICMASGGSGDAVEGPRDAALSRAFGVIGARFREWLSSAEDTELTPEELDARWRQILRVEAQRVAQELVSGAGPRAWRGHVHNERRIDVGLADVWFQRALSKAVPNTPPSGIAASQEQEVRS